jgi:hypothetical protein
MLDYFGPQEWKTLVDGEEPQPVGVLLDATHAAEEILPRQGFDIRRTRYLVKHLRALSTVARRLAGERLSLIEQAAGCFDLDVGWVAEERFEEAGDLLDHALPARATRIRSEGLRGESDGRVPHRATGANKSPICREKYSTPSQGFSSSSTRERPIQPSAWMSFAPKFTVANSSPTYRRALENRLCGTPLESKRDNLVAVVAPLCFKGG